MTRAARQLLGTNSLFQNTYASPLAVCVWVVYIFIDGAKTARLVSTVVYTYVCAYVSRYVHAI